MEKIHKFKKEVLTLNICAKVNNYPGNPFYIGKLEDERIKKSLEKSDYKEFISDKNHDLYKELTSTEPVSQYYVELVDDALLFDIFEEALFSTGHHSLEDLKVVLDLLESYKYDDFFEELDLLDHKFLNTETTKEDEHRFKAVLRKQFGYSMPQSGKITTVFLSSLRREMKNRVDYLNGFKEMIEKVIAIKDTNEAIAFTKTIGLEFFPNNDPAIQSLIDSNIERRQVRPLFEFIDFLYLNRTVFIEYNSFVGEYERLKKERESMSLSKNYKGLLALKEIDHKIEAKKVLIHTNITEPIIKKMEYLDVYDVFEYDIDSDSHTRMMSGTDNQKKYCSANAFELIKLYEKRYVEFREETNYNDYDCCDLFEVVDNMLEDLFSFVHKDDVSKLKVSKEKHLESIGALSIKSATDNNLQTFLSNTNSKKGGSTETLRENETSITHQTKSLFNFIDFLHSNIDNFNQYLDDVFDMNSAKLMIDYLGTHITEVKEKKDHQKEVDEKWDVIFRNIKNPIKEKVAELDVFNWYKPETLLNKHMPLVSSLSKNCNEQDLDLVYKAKKQYIQFTNEANLYVIKQNELIFRYLNKVMLVVAEDFKEDGDLSIHTELLREYNTWQEEREDDELHGIRLLLPISNDYIRVEKEEGAGLEKNNIDGRSKNLDEHEIFELIKELTKKNYIEKSYRFMISDFTPRWMEYFIIIHLFKEIYGKLDEEFKFLFFNGKVELLQRIKILLQNGFQNLETYYDDEGHFLEIAHEDGDKESIKSIKTKQHLFKTKKYFTKKLLYVLIPYTDKITHKDSFVETSNILDYAFDEFNELEKKPVKTKNIEVTKSLEQITSSENKPLFYHPSPTKYTAKHYVLAFLFDCLATGIKYMEYCGKKKELETIGNSRVNNEISGNRFYKVFNEITNIGKDLENKENLIYLAGDNWREIIINLSNEPDKVSEYLKEKGL